MRRMIQSAVLAMLCLPCSIYGQWKTFTIEGSIQNAFNGMKLYLAYKQEDKRILDSTVISSGKFSFSGKIEEGDYLFATIAADHENAGFPALLAKRLNIDARKFVLVAGSVTISSRDSVSRAEIDDVTGANTDNRELENLDQPIHDRFRNLSADTARAAIEEITRLGSQEKEMLVRFIKDHPNSLISLEALDLYGGSFPDVSISEKYFNQLSPQVKQGKAGKRYAGFLQNYASINVGSQAPDFKQADTAGQLIQLSALRGKYVLLDFWASWCGPCRLKNPYLVKIFQRFRNKPFIILGISLDRSRKDWLDAIAKDGLSWQQLSDLKHWNNEVAMLYGIKAIPLNFLLDPSGKIIRKDIGLDALEEFLDKLPGK